MSWSDFFSMGGYAFYVWGSYLVTLIAIGGEIFFLLRRKRSLTDPGISLRELNKNEKAS